MEATAFGVRWIVDTLATPASPSNASSPAADCRPNRPLLMQIYADVLDEEIGLAASDQSVALGAAILGCLAAGETATGYASICQAIHAMARAARDLVYRPDLSARKQYAKIYEVYRDLTNPIGPVAAAMRRLRELSVG